MVQVQTPQHRGPAGFQWRRRISVSDLQLHGEQISGGPATQCNTHTHIYIELWIMFLRLQYLDNWTLNHQFVFTGPIKNQFIIRWRKLTDTQHATHRHWYVISVCGCVLSGAWRSLLVSESRYGWRSISSSAVPPLPSRQTHASYPRRRQKVNIAYTNMTSPFPLTTLLINLRSAQRSEISEGLYSDILSTQ